MTTMHIDQLLTQSLQLMILGMGTVFVILSLLIGLVSLSSRLLRDDSPQHGTAASPAAAAGQPSEEVIAVIQAAIHSHLKATR